MSYTAINFAEKFTRFTDQWQPRVIAEGGGGAAGAVARYPGRWSGAQVSFELRNWPRG